MRDIYSLWTKLPWRALLLHVYGDAFPPKPDVCSGQLKGHFIEVFTLEAIVWQIKVLLNVDNYISSCYCFYILRESLFVADRFWQFEFPHRKDDT